MPWTILAKTGKTALVTLKVSFFLFMASIAVGTCVVIWAFQFKLNNYPVYIYSSPTKISVGDDIDYIELVERLNRLGYTRTTSGNVGLGSWRLSELSMTINFRRPSISGYRITEGPVTINLESKRIKDIRLMRSQRQTTELSLEPEILSIIPAKGYSPELCRFAPIDHIPSLLIDAIIQTEDSNFFSHHGIDWSSLLVAIKSNLEAGRYVQGASTITQQLIKMTLLSNEKTLWRKINEIVLSVVADAIYSKSAILEAYLNHVYFGQLGAFPINGVHEAANELLGKSLEELDASDCALLAATIRAPNVINPFRHPERATGRRNIVLGLLLKNGQISREIYDEAILKPVTMQKPSSIPVKVPNLLDVISATEAMQNAVQDKTNRYVVTTLDPLLQLRVDAGLRKFLDASFSTQVLAVSPDNSAILVFYDPAGLYRESMEADMDLFSPLALVPAFSTEKKGAPKYALTSHVFLKDPESGSMTILESFKSNRQALVGYITQTMGADRIVGALRDVGVSVDLKSSGEIFFRPVDIKTVAKVYSAMATVGDEANLSFIYPQPHLDHPDLKPGKKPSVNPSAMYLVNHMLKSISAGIDECDNAASDLNRVPSRFISQDPRGVWGITYNSGALLVVRLNGAIRDSRKLSSFMDYVMTPLLNRNSSSHVPAGIVFRKICSESGLKATSICQKISLEPFIPGTQPHEWCPLRHQLETKKGFTGKMN